MRRRRWLMRRRKSHETHEPRTSKIWLAMPMTTIKSSCPSQFMIRFPPQKQVARPGKRKRSIVRSQCPFCTSISSLAQPFASSEHTRTRLQLLILTPPLVLWLLLRWMIQFAFGISTLVDAWVIWKDTLLRYAPYRLRITFSQRALWMRPFDSGTSVRRTMTLTAAWEKTTMRMLSLLERITTLNPHLVAWLIALCTHWNHMSTRSQPFTSEAMLWFPVLQTRRFAIGILKRAVACK